MSQPLLLTVNRPHSVQRSITFTFKYYGSIIIQEKQGISYVTQEMVKARDLLLDKQPYFCKIIKLLQCEIKI